MRVLIAIGLFALLPVLARADEPKGKKGVQPIKGVQRERPRVVLTVPPAAVHPVRGVAVSPDKSTVAAGRANRIDLYDAGSGTFVRELSDPGLATPDQKPLKAAHLSLIESLAFSPDGK